MQPIKAADDRWTDHIDNRFGRRWRCPDRLKRGHALLDGDFGPTKPVLPVRHLRSLLPVKVAYFGRASYRHNRHAVGAGVRFHHDEWFLLDAVLAVLFGYQNQNLIDERCETVLALALLKIDMTAIAK